MAALGGGNILKQIKRHIEDVDKSLQPRLIHVASSLLDEEFRALAKKLDYPLPGLLRKPSLQPRTPRLGPGGRDYHRYMALSLTQATSFLAAHHFDEARCPMGVLASIVTGNHSTCPVDQATYVGGRIAKSLR